jgi:hypothetical protein
MRSRIFAAVVLHLCLGLGVESELHAQEQTGAPSLEIPLDYYGEIGCSHCDTFVEKVLPPYEERYDIVFSVTVHDILSAEGYAECEERLKSMGRPFSVFPVLFIGNNAYQGNSAIEENLPEEIRYIVEKGSFRPPVLQELDGSASSVSMKNGIRLLPVFLAGLADGVNPCAFTTMLFLISLLVLFGRSRRDVFFVGMLFGATIFFTYLLLGFGVLTLFRQAMDVTLLRRVMRILISAAALFFAVLSLRDARRLRLGRGREASLSLSEKTRRRIHSVMRRNLKGGGLIVSTIAAAFLVSLLELACTGQLYLPTIVYLLQTGAPEAEEIFALILYNVAFILPLCVLFAAVLLGLDSNRINRIFKKNAAASKVFTAAVFFILAIVVWIA